MDRWEAATLLQEGKKVRKKNWPKDDYIFLDKNAGLMDRTGRLIPETIFADISELWEEYGEFMTFGEAMVALEQGKRVRCKKWGLKDYIFLSSDKKVLDQYGHSCTSILFDAINEEWEECGWKYVDEETKTMTQIVCPCCSVFTYKEISDTHYIYCPHCGAKVVK